MQKSSGKVHYFWKCADDPTGQAAFERWRQVRDDLLAGRKPRPQTGDLTVTELCNRYLTFHQRRRDAIEISPRTFQTYHAACANLVASLSRNRVVSDIGPDDLQKLREKLFETRKAAVSRRNEMQRIRSVFKYGFDQGLLATPIRFGQAFTNPKQEVVRHAREVHRAQHGERMFEAHEIRELLDGKLVQLPKRLVLRSLAITSSRESRTVGQGMIYGRMRNVYPLWRSSPRRRNWNSRPRRKVSTSCFTFGWRSSDSSSKRGKMKFDELDEKMRIYETAADYCVLPGLFMVARLDGRSFTRLTKEICQFEAPFDARFRDMLLETAESLMGCGFRVIYAFTESDEISLLFDPNEQLFGRKLRKYNSTLAGEASGKFSLLLGRVATFDCRISQLPTLDLVVDYFRWRSEDAARNALNAYCYWTHRKLGFDERLATEKIFGLSVAQKNELLFQQGINFNDTGLHEVITPHMIPMLRPQSHAGTVVQPQPSPLRLFLRHFQPFLTPETFDPFMVD